MDEEVPEENDGPRGGSALRAQIFSMDEEEAEDSFDQDSKGLGGGGSTGLDRLDMYDDQEQAFRGSSTPRGGVTRRAPGSKAVTPRGSVRFVDDGNDEQHEELQRRAAEAQELARVSEWVGGWVGTYESMYARA
jgi:hypothetical protein